MSKEVLLDVRHLTQQFHLTKKIKVKAVDDAPVTEGTDVQVNEEETVPADKKEEVEAVRWMDYEECRKKIADVAIPNCINPEEFEKLGSYLGIC